MGMKFAMGANALAQLGQRTSSSHEDLGALVRRLEQSAAPLEGRFNGAGRRAFDEFKAHTDAIASELNSALAAVLSGIQGQDTAFQQGDSDMSDQTRSAQSGAGFDSARFSGRA